MAGFSTIYLDEKSAGGFITSYTETAAGSPLTFSVTTYSGGKIQSIDTTGSNNGSGFSGTTAQSQRTQIFNTAGQVTSDTGIIAASSTFKAQASQVPDRLRDVLGRVPISGSASHGPVRGSRPPSPSWRGDVRTMTNPGIFLFTKKGSLAGCLSEWASGQTTCTGQGRPLSVPPLSPLQSRPGAPLDQSGGRSNPR